FQAPRRALPEEARGVIVPHGARIHARESRSLSGKSQWPLPFPGQAPRRRRSALTSPVAWGNLSPRKRDPERGAPRARRREGVEGRVSPLLFCAAAGGDG